MVVEFIEWLRAYNDALPSGAEKVGFYGLDLLQPARVDDGLMTRLNLSKSCEEEVVGQLLELKRRAAGHLRRAGRLVDDELFYAEQNARLVKNAEAYYRAVFLEEVSSWNLRDRHKAETLDALVSHLGRKGSRAKIAVWEHNSHLGDARATEMGQRGELNVGQLTREKYADEAVLIGFTTHHGTVTAASDWGKSAERKHALPALAGSYEALFHTAGRDRFLLVVSDSDMIAQQLHHPRSSSGQSA